MVSRANIQISEVICEAYEVTGSQDVKTLYSKKITHGKIAVITFVGATIMDADRLVQEDTQYIRLGYERNGKKYYIKGQDVSGAGSTVFAEMEIFIREGDRLFADFEAGVDTDIYQLVISGYYLITNGGY